MTAVRALRPSYIVLPRDNQDHPLVIEFLIGHFSQIPASVWRQRVLDGKVHWQDGSLISLETEYRPMAKVYYFREVEVETKIPFCETILFQDDNIVIAYKPHFLGVSPSGNFVNECLIHRLCVRLNIDTIAPAHRLDRDTAGVILLTKNPDYRHAYHQLFKAGTITKQYQALARLTPDIAKAIELGDMCLPHHWTVKNRIAAGTPSFLRQVVKGEGNSHSEISLIAVKEGFGLFKLSPITGKTHQLRVHMQSLGMPLLNDRFYPELAPKGPDNFDKPLALLAKRLKFVDPITHVEHDISCKGLDDFALLPQ